MKVIKYGSLFCSFLIFTSVGIFIHIERIRLEEYALFDPSTKAVNDALAFKSVDTFYFPIILITHLTFLFAMVVKDIRKNVTKC